MATSKAALDRVNVLNIALMVLSCALAYIAPLHLFLFVYAVLGPAHYLTEISWLHDRRYFLAKPSYAWWLVLPCLLIAGMTALGTKNAAVTTGITAAAFGVAAVLVFARSTTERVVVSVGVALIAVALAQEKWAVIVFAILLPTILHVLVFTAVFVLLGSLKSRSLSGYASLAVFVACVAAPFVFQPAAWLAPGEQARAAFGGFLQLAALLGQAVGWTFKTRPEVFESAQGTAVLRLIAFAYTYHYLNWFSKTSIIGWHTVSKQRLSVMAVIWVAAVGLYAWDYALGLQVLLFLSVLHVMLEFPLNHQSFAGVARELTGRVRALAAPSVSARP